VQTSNREPLCQRDVPTAPTRKGTDIIVLLGDLAVFLAQGKSLVLHQIARLLRLLRPLPQLLVVCGCEDEVLQQPLHQRRRFDAQGLAVIKRLELFLKGHKRALSLRVHADRSGVQPQPCVDKHGRKGSTRALSPS